MSASTSPNPLTYCSSTGTVEPPFLHLGTQLMWQWGWIWVIFQETALPKISQRSLTSHNRCVCVCMCVGVIQFVNALLLISGNFQPCCALGYSRSSSSVSLPLSTFFFIGMILKLCNWQNLDGTSAFTHKDSASFPRRSTALMHHSSNNGGSPQNCSEKLNCHFCVLIVSEE